jgi:hypothetical protein
MTNHRKVTTGVIKQGFHRNDYYRECERIFDEHFKHNRAVEQSFDYCNAMRHGSEEERAEQLRRYVAQMHLEMLVTEETVRLWRQCAYEAESQDPFAGKTEEQQEKIRMNMFWNTYHSHYEPLLDSLKKDCQEAFKIYDRAKQIRLVNSEQLDCEFNKLKSCYAQVENLKQDLSKTKTSKAFLLAFSLLISAVNPVPAIFMMAMGSFVLGVRQNVIYSNRAHLYEKANKIQENISVLKERQETLRHAKNDALREYLSVKDQREDLKDQLNSMKRALSITAQELEIDPIKQEKREQYLSIPFAKDTHLLEHLIAIFSYKKDREELDKELYYRGVVCQPIMHPNGGVADLLFIRGKETIRCGKLVPEEYAPAFVKQWCKIVGRTPAFTIRTESPKVQDQERKPIQELKNKQNHGPKLRR